MCMTQYSRDARRLRGMFPSQDVEEGCGEGKHCDEMSAVVHNNTSHEAVESIEGRSYEVEDSVGLLRSVRDDEDESASSELQIIPAAVSWYGAGHGSTSATDAPTVADECTICLEEVSMTPPAIA
jgi:hypothetical protein